MFRQMLNFCEGVMLMWSSKGMRSRKAASLTWWVLRPAGAGAVVLKVVGATEEVGSGAGAG